MKAAHNVLCAMSTIAIGCTLGAMFASQLVGAVCAAVTVALIAGAVMTKDHE